MTTCWILTEGLKGTENQCIALAEAAGFSYEIKAVQLKNPWKIVTPWITHFSPHALAPGSAALQAPWPQVVIASGRKAIAPALWVKRQSGNKTKLVIVQSPVIRNKNFDLVIAPVHDRYRGDKLLEITGALSLITPQKLAAARAEWALVLGALPAPRLAVLIGGTSRTHRFTDEIVNTLLHQLQDLIAQGYSLMVTASRRTPEDIRNRLRKALGLSTPLPNPLPLRERVGERGIKPDHIHFYDGSGPNPYQAYLAWSDAILVTEDSVSMASEAVSTGKPVYIIKMAGGSSRFARFHGNLIAKGFARWFEGRIESWPYHPPDDLRVSATTVLKL